MASGFFAAKFFGAISAKIITRIVRINVPTHTYSSPNSFITKYVKRAEAEIFTKLFPIKITPNTSLILFLKELTLLAAFCPLSAALSSFIWLIAVMEVSDPEKKADIKIRMIRTNISTKPKLSICVINKINQKNKK